VAVGLAVGFAIYMHRESIQNKSVAFKDNIIAAQNRNFIERQLQEHAHAFELWTAINDTLDKIKEMSVKFKQTEHASRQSMFTQKFAPIQDSLFRIRGYIELNPDEAWRIHEATQTISQAATLSHNLGSFLLFAPYEKLQDPRLDAHNQELSNIAEFLDRCLDNLLLSK